MGAVDSLPDDVEVLKTLLRARDAELARSRAEASNADALIAHLRLTIEKMQRDLFGVRSERKARLLDQMELELEELEAAATEDELAAEQVAAPDSDVTSVRGFSRRKPSRKPFPAHLPREHVVVPGPTACAWRRHHRAGSGQRQDGELDAIIGQRCAALAAERDIIKSRAGFHWWPKSTEPK